MASQVDLAPPETALTVFVARQPVFDRRLRVRGYELRYRSSFQAVLGRAFAPLDWTTSTARVMASSALERLTGDKPAHLPFTRELLLHEHATLLPRDRVVVELGADVEPDEVVVDACRRLQRLGYRLALAVSERTPPSPLLSPLIATADLIRVDFAAIGSAGRASLARRFASSEAGLLAEGVDDATALTEAMRLGYVAFRGAFFSRPSVIAAKDIAVSASAHASLLAALHQPELDLAAVEATFRRDVALADKLLRFINSAAFGWRHHIGSFRHALVLLGDAQVRKWVSLVVLAELAAGKPTELVTQSLVRAHMCESLGVAAGLQRARLDLFLVGMYSLIDVILDQPLDAALSALPLSAEVAAALGGEENALRCVLDTVVAYEGGDWERAASGAADDLALPEERLPEAYRDALEFVSKLPNV